MRVSRVPVFFYCLFLLAWLLFFSTWGASGFLGRRYSKAILMRYPNIPTLRIEMMISTGSPPKMYVPRRKKSST
jgi:hypothetical protein